LKSSSWRPVILSVISLGLVAAFLCYLYFNADKYLDLLKFSIPDMVIIFILSLAFPLISGVSNAHLFRSMGADISYKDGFFLAAASTLANQLPISGGILSKGFYLKRRHEISYAKFFSATTALFFCFLAVNGIIGVFLLLYWYIAKNIPVSPTLMIGFLLMVAGLIVFCLPLEQIKFPQKIHKWIHQAIEGWMLISRNLVLLLRLIGLQTILMLLLAIRYWLAFRMLSQNISLDQAILFSAASILTQLVSIAPGGLGVREVIVSAVASALGFDLGASITAVGLDRLISTLGIYLIGGASSMVLSKQISEPPTQRDEQESSPILDENNL
jgi:uncharacterized membrane protein YbhN (UPF0104 family)